MTASAYKPSVLLIVGGGIAAYKSLELIRLLRGADYRGADGPDQGRRAIRHAAVARQPERRKGLSTICFP